MSGNRPVLGALQQWAHVLHEPYLPARRRAHLETGLTQAHAEQPQQVQLFFAGFVSDILLTLPERDVWRNLSARYGDCTVGSAPPVSDGAVTPAGGRFGTWRDAVDLTPLVYASPFDDRNLIALVDDLSPAAAAIVAAAGFGYRMCLTMIEAVYAGGAPRVEDSVVDMFTRQSFIEASDKQFVLDACVDAARWVLHRRRGYTGPVDDWPEDAVSRWAWRATRGEKVRGWKDADVAAEISLFQITQLAPQDRDAEPSLSDLFGSDADADF